MPEPRTPQSTSEPVRAWEAGQAQQAAGYGAVSGTSGRAVGGPVQHSLSSGRLYAVPIMNIAAVNETGHQTIHLDSHHLFSLQRQLQSTELSCCCTEKQTSKTLLAEA